MKTYLKVKWLHGHADEPILLYSELDADRYELRKVEVFADGTMGYASDAIAVRGTQLGEVPLPTADEIASDPQFVVELSDKDDFENIWDLANRSSS